MNNQTEIEQLRIMRDKLPKGRKDPWPRKDMSKRVLLRRALNKTTVADFTVGELSAFNEWLSYLKKYMKKQAANNRKINNVIDHGEQEG